MSPGRTAVFKRRAQLDEEAVAHAVAEAVVDELEPVHVQEHHGEHALVVAARHGALQAGQGRLQAVDEERAVGQAGERVVEGVVLELLLRAPAIRDVGADGGGARDLSRPVPQDGVAPPHHAPVAVAGHDRRLFVRGHRAEVHAVAQGRPPRLPVFLRHEGREPLAPDHVLLLVPDQLQEEGIAIRDDALAVEEHGHELDRLQDVAHAALGLAHGFFGPAALGDVERGHQRRGLPAEVEGAAGELDPAIVGPGEARLVAEAGHRGGRRLQHAVADDVVGIRVEAVEEGALDEVGGATPVSAAAAWFA